MDDHQRFQHVTRERVRAKFRNALGGDATKATALEILLYNYVADDPRLITWKDIRYRYTTKASSLCFNLTHPTNPGIGRAVRGEIRVSLETMDDDTVRLTIVDDTMKLRDFFNMTPYQMYPSLWEPFLVDVAKRQLQKTILLDTDGHDGAFTCGRCKSKKTQYVELQTRSADEPATIYVFCGSCGNSWKC